MNINNFKRVFKMMGYSCAITDLGYRTLSVTISKPDSGIKVARNLDWISGDLDQYLLNFIESITSDYEHIRNVEERKTKYEHTTEPIGKVQHICKFKPDENGVITFKRELLHPEDVITFKFNPNFVAKAMGSDTVDEVFSHLTVEEHTRAALRDTVTTANEFNEFLKKRFNVGPYPPKAKKNTLQIKNVIFADPATIVFWEDGTKTVVKAKNETYDPEKGLAMAISKKALGNKHDYFIVFKKWLKKAKG